MNEEEDEEEFFVLAESLKHSAATCSHVGDIMESGFSISAKKELLCAFCASLLLCSAVASAEEGAHLKNSQCHNYAGGHVYPGEAFRVPVSDHSLHLSKAKSEFLALEFLIRTF